MKKMTVLLGQQKCIATDSKIQTDSDSKTYSFFWS